MNINFTKIQIYVGKFSTHGSLDIINWKRHTLIIVLTWAPIDAWCSQEAFISHDSYLTTQLRQFLILFNAVVIYRIPYMIKPL